MFKMDSQPTITEFLVESADSVVELDDSTTDSSPDLARIGLLLDGVRIGARIGQF